jgi:hypothetical protein
MFSKNYNAIQGINANPKALAQANDQTASLSLLFRLRFDFRFSFDVWRSSFDVVRCSPYQIRRSSSDIIAKAVRRVPHLVRDAAYRDEQLATCERACQVICSFTTSFAQGVVEDSADSIAEAFFELLDILLVGSGELGDLICHVMVNNSALCVVDSGVANL